MPSSSIQGSDLFGGIPHPTSSSFEALCLFCEAHASEVAATLPWLASEIGHNDGHSTMLHFVRTWSGTRIYVTRDHAQFVERVGCDIGASTHGRLVREAGVGAQVEVPSAWGLFMALRRVAVAIAVRSSLPHAEISRRFGVTMRSLR